MQIKVKKTQNYSCYYLSINICNVNVISIFLLWKLEKWLNILYIVISFTLSCSGWVNKHFWKANLVTSNPSCEQCQTSLKLHCVWFCFSENVHKYECFTTGQSLLCNVIKSKFTQGICCIHCRVSRVCVSVSVWASLTRPIRRLLAGVCGPFTDYRLINTDISISSFIKKEPCVYMP